MTGKCIIFSAPSGAGKTTIVKNLLSRGLNMEFSISATSRKPRPGEVDGKDYYFLSPERFQVKIENEQLVEWEEVYSGTYYGTLKSELERIWSNSNHVLFDVDVKGGLNLKKIFGKNALSIFIQPPSIEELENRLRNRCTEDEESIRKRIGKATEELSFAPKFDFVIVNDDLKTAQDEAFEVILEFITK